MSRKRKRHGAPQEMVKFQEPKPQTLEIPQEALFPPLPPDHIFKNRKDRATPSNSVAERYVTYLWDTPPVEYIPGQGIFSRYQGIELPRKGLPFSQAVYAINGTKRFITNTFRVLSLKEALLPMIGFVLTPKKIRTRLLEKALISFNNTADMMMDPYYLDASDEGYYCKTSKEIIKFTRASLMSLGISNDTAQHTGEVLAMIFEFDDAYRYRFQDIMSETSKEGLIDNFRFVLDRLFQVYLSRENAGSLDFFSVPIKVRNLIRVIKIVWLVPSIRKAVRSGLKAVEFKNWQLDEADIFHTLLYADYNVQGKTLEERVKTYFSYYENDESKAPKRVEIRTK